MVSIQGFGTGLFGSRCRGPSGSIKATFPEPGSACRRVSGLRNRSGPKPVTPNMRIFPSHPSGTSVDQWSDPVGPGTQHLLDFLADHRGGNIGPRLRAHLGGGPGRHYHGYRWVSPLTPGRPTCSPKGGFGDLPGREAPPHAPVAQLDSASVFGKFWEFLPKPRKSAVFPGENPGFRLLPPLSKTSLYVALRALPWRNYARSFSASVAFTPAVMPAAARAENPTVKAPSTRSYGLSWPGAITGPRGATLRPTVAYGRIKKARLRGRAFGVPRGAGYFCDGGGSSNGPSSKRHRWPSAHSIGAGLSSARISCEQSGQTQ